MMEIIIAREGETIFGAGRQGYQIRRRKNRGAGTGEGTHPNHQFDRLVLSHRWGVE